MRERRQHKDGEHCSEKLKNLYSSPNMYEQDDDIKDENTGEGQQSHVNNVLVKKEINKQNKEIMWKT